MAGEWIPVDCNVFRKPEVLAVAAATGETAQLIVGRMVCLWTWAWEMTVDGTIRVPASMLPAVAGGDEQFWRAIERAGWLVCTEDSITIPGWERRFGNAAKRRLLDARSKAVRRMSAASPHDERTSVGQGQDIQDPPAPAAKPKSPPADASRGRPAARVAPVTWTADGGWSGITDADRREWAEAFPGAVLDQELARATAWLHANPTKAGKRNWRRFLVNWLQRVQDGGGSNREPGRRPGRTRQIINLD